MGEDASLATAATAARAFARGAAVGPLSPLGSGLIHSTFAAPVAGPDARELVIQQLNTEVFRDPDALMQNLVRITQHLRRSARASGDIDVARHVLEVVETAEREPLFRDADGGVWRAFPRIAGGTEIGTSRDPKRLRSAASAFARYARDLGDLPGPPLHETLPNFHDFAARRRAFDAAVARDAQRRAGDAQAEIDALRRTVDTLEHALPAATLAALPQRVAHHDCKLDNLLFDAATGEALCVLDLDTTMPGSWLSDFGELVRSATSGSAGEAGGDAVRFDVDAFAALARGYLEAVGDQLTDTERTALPLAGAHMAVMNALRFATDHLEGDVYFRLFRPGQNLERARSQRRLAAKMLANIDALRARFETTASP
jgi:hypothetical protein